MRNPDYVRYLKGDEGKAMTQLFTFNEDDDPPQKAKAIYQLTKSNLLYSDFKDFFDWLRICMASIDEVMADLPADIQEEDEVKPEMAEEFIKDFQLCYVDENDVPQILLPHSQTRRLAMWMPLLSLALYIVGEMEIFYPVLYQQNFRKFRACCDVLGIELSPVPLQKNPEERCLYLVDICRKIEDFRVANSLTKPEVCALLYGYAPEIVAYMESNITQETPILPTPTRIWMTGASKEDWKAGLLEKDENVWAGNERTLRGDIVVIYALSPHSCIHSVWRAVDDGEANPFDYYVNRVAVGHRTDVPRITFKELKDDPAMSQVPMVRDNLQGINGKELAYKDYQSLLDMFAAKGFDIATLPNLEAPRLGNDNKDILVEDDVSVKKLIPLLSLLGYSYQNGEDWTRELVLKVGRDRATDENGWKPRPDFTFFPRKFALEQQAAPFLIEVKYLMKNTEEIRSALAQAISYARQLNTSLVGVCDKDIFRLYRADRRGDFSDNKSLCFDSTWAKIREDAETFNALRKLIGRDVVIRMK